MSTSFENPQADGEIAEKMLEQSQEMLNRFLASHPEYAGRNFTPAELTTAAQMLANVNTAGTDDELSKKALDARLTIRQHEHGTLPGPSVDQAA